MAVRRELVAASEERRVGGRLEEAYVARLGARGELSEPLNLRSSPDERLLPVDVGEAPFDN